MRTNIWRQLELPDSLVMALNVTAGALQKSACLKCVTREVFKGAFRPKTNRGVSSREVESGGQQAGLEF